ncbi:MAG: hypothetical protein Q9195_002251 [Heterodermia aff. obscurata]
MTQKCVHKGCGKSFTDSEEECVYHPGPPEFHEGQKGWKCCKPRVLTFDEFLSIPPCTTGKHSTIDDTPKPEQVQPTEEDSTSAPPAVKPISRSTNRDSESVPASRVPIAAQPVAPNPQAPAPESDSDDLSIPIPSNTTCRRRGCNTSSSSIADASSRENEECVYHPGQALFHEGTKGWTCCKRRVLEFDEFMKIEGCAQKKKHLFVGSGKKASGEEALSEAPIATFLGASKAKRKPNLYRNDFYQTGTTVIASFYLKKIDKARALVEFKSSTSVSLDLPTTDHKRYKTDLPLFGQIKADRSTFKIMGTKLELTLAKEDGLGWPVLRSDENRGSNIIQVGKAGRA